MKSCGVIMMKPKVYTQLTIEPSTHEYHDLCVWYESE